AQVDSGGGPVCSLPLTLCGSSCTDLSKDSFNCGKCGVPCPQGYSCNQGNCASPVDMAMSLDQGQTCPGGMTLCNGSVGPSCTDLSKDPANCGGCGYTCAGGAQCQA